MSMSYKIDQASVDNVRSMLRELSDFYKPVMTTAINKTLSTVQTQATARIGNELNLTASRIKKDMTITKSSYSNISGKLSCTGEPVGLIEYGAEDTSSGVTVKVLKSSGRSPLKHAFIAVGKNDNIHVFWRQRDQIPIAKIWPTGKKTQRNWKNIPNKYRGIPYKGTPFWMDKLTGPRIEDIFAKESVFDPVSIQASTVYLNYLNDEIESVFRRFG